MRLVLIIIKLFVKLIIMVFITHQLINVIYVFKMVNTRMEIVFMMVYHLPQLILRVIVKPVLQLWNLVEPTKEMPVII